MIFHHISNDYLKGELDDETTGMGPEELFKEWLHDAISFPETEPTAMSLSTVGEGNIPESRIVLLKSFEGGRPTFFTNYLSKKGKAMATNPQVALLFFWPLLQRQIRITGAAARVPEEESDNYFASRPVESQISAWASHQSQQAGSRAFLEKKFNEYAAKFEGEKIPRPAHWGGYSVEPVCFEFWQGRTNRLHDRIVFRKVAGKWESSRLMP